MSKRISLLEKTNRPEGLDLVECSLETVENGEGLDGKLEEDRKTGDNAYQTALFIVDDLFKKGQIDKSEMEFLVKVLTNGHASKNINETLQNRTWRQVASKKEAKWNEDLNEGTDPYKAALLKLRQSKNEWVYNMSECLREFEKNDVFLRDVKETIEECQEACEAGLKEWAKAINESIRDDYDHDNAEIAYSDFVDKEFYDDQDIARLDALQTQKYEKDLASRKALIDKIGKLCFLLKYNSDFKRNYKKLSRDDRKTVKYLVDDVAPEVRKMWSEEVMSDEAKDSAETVFGRFVKKCGKKLDDLGNVLQTVIYGLGFDN